MPREPLIKAEFSGSRGLAVADLQSDCTCMAQVRLSSTDFGTADAASPSDLISASLGNAGGDLLITAKSCQLLQFGPKSLYSARKKPHSEGRRESMGIVRCFAS